MHKSKSLIVNHKFCLLERQDSISALITSKTNETKSFFSFQPTSKFSFLLEILHYLHNTCNSLNGQFRSKYSPLAATPSTCLSCRELEIRWLHYIGVCITRKYILHFPTWKSMWNISFFQNCYVNNIIY